MYRWATTKTWVVYNTLSSHPLLFFNNLSNLSISQKSWVCADQWKRLWLSVPHFKYSPKSFLFDTTALDESVAMALVGEMLYTYIICSKHIIVIIIVASFWGGQKRHKGSLLIHPTWFIFKFIQVPPIIQLWFLCQNFVVGEFGCFQKVWYPKMDGL